MAQGSEEGSLQGDTARDETTSALWIDPIGCVMGNEEERSRLGGGDSPDGREYRDQMSSAQQALRERSMQSHDMRQLASDE